MPRQVDGHGVYLLRWRKPGIKGIARIMQGRSWRRGVPKKMWIDLAAEQPGDKGDEGDALSPAIGFCVQEGSLVELIRLCGGADVDRGVGGGVLPVWRGYRQVKCGRDTSEARRQVHISGATKVSIGLVGTRRKEPSLL